MNNKVLVIIVTYNGIYWIKRCLDSILESILRVDCIVIDNGSTDGTQNFIWENYSFVKLVQNKGNKGFGRANNIGFKYALEHKYEYVYLLNQDAWIEPNTIDRLVTIHKKYPEFGILSPFQVQANRTFLDVNFGEVICSYHSNSNIINDFYFNRREELYEVPFVMAAHWLVSCDCLSKVGGFSPTFPHYGEDNNYIDRARYHGFKIGIATSTIAVHDREDRVESINHLIYMNYISILIRLSNINELPQSPLLCAVINTIKSVLRYKSVAPLKYLNKVLLNWKRIRKNNNCSKGYLAFLNNL